MSEQSGSTALDTRQNPSPGSHPTASLDKENGWKLENSSLWWLSHDIFQHPGNVLLLSSIPFCAGAYIGFTKPMEKMEKMIGSTTPTESNSNSNGSSNIDKKFGSEAERRALGFRLASRALRIATFSSVGTFGMLGAGM